MKVCSRGRIFDPTHLNSMEQALNYVYTLPVSTVIVGHDNIKQLIENALITQRFKPLTKLEMEQLEEKTSEYANLALFFRKGFEKFNPFWKPYGF
jgi:predicted aldo/keto reductase-like oxidoreductase